MPIDSLPPSDLYQYLRYLRASGQITERFELVFWQKVTLPVAVVVMMLCSFPFVFGSMRVTSAGKRIVLATITGISFQLISQLLANLGLMLNLSPLLMVATPIVAILILGVLLMRHAFRSLSDLGDRSEHDGRARTNDHDFEAHSGPTQREIGDIWAALHRRSRLMLSPTGS